MADDFSDDFWNMDQQARAKLEGWGVFEHQDAGAIIQRVGDRFASDEDALAHVAARAAQDRDGGELETAAAHLLDVYNPDLWRSIRPDIGESFKAIAANNDQLIESEAASMAAANLAELRSGTAGVYEHANELMREGLEPHDAFAFAEAKAQDVAASFWGDDQPETADPQSQRIAINLTTQQARVVLANIYGGKPEIVEPIQREILNALAAQELRQVNTVDNDVGAYIRGEETPQTTYPTAGDGLVTVGSQPTPEDQRIQNILEGWGDMHSHYDVEQRADGQGAFFVVVRTFEIDDNMRDEYGIGQEDPVVLEADTKEQLYDMILKRDLTTSSSRRATNSDLPGGGDDHKQTVAVIQRPTETTITRQQPNQAPQTEVIQTPPPPAQTHAPSISMRLRQALRF